MNTKEGRGRRKPVRDTGVKKKQRKTTNCILLTWLANKLWVQFRRQNIHFHRSTTGSWIPHFSWCCDCLQKLLESNEWNRVEKTLIVCIVWNTGYWLSFVSHASIQQPPDWSQHRNERSPQCAVVLQHISIHIIYSNSASQTPQSTIYLELQHISQPNTRSHLAGWNMPRQEDIW